MKQIEGQTISEQWTEFAVLYPDDEAFIVESEEEAEEIVKAAAVVGADFKVIYREVFVTDWES